MAFKIVGVDENNLFPDRVEDRLSNQFADKNTVMSEINALPNTYVKRGNTTVSVVEYGADPTGYTDSTSAINLAMVENNSVYMPEGTYLVSDEIKVPSDTTLRGSGINSTKIVMATTALRKLNTITNSLNNRQSRTNYDKNIYLSDFTVDSKALDRPDDGLSWEGNASGIYFSTVQDSVIERVRSINAPLHCFSVDASWLPDEISGSPSSYPAGPSFNVVIRDCIAENPYIDDGFTTHYSHDIVIENCVARIAQVNNASPGVQNGFEIDDGSSFVTVRNCTAIGWQNGFQAKGHVYAPPAHDIEFNNCIADSNACGFALSSASNPIGRNIRLVGCSVIRAAAVGTESNQQTSLKIWDYPDVFIRDFTVIDSPFGGILITAKGVIVIDGLVFRNSGTLAELPDQALIRITGDSTTSGSLTISNVSVENQIVGGSVLRNNYTESAFAMEVSNMNASGVAAYPAISDSYFSNDRHFNRISTPGFGSAIAFRGGSASPVNSVQGTMPVLMGSVDPNTRVGAKVGSLYVRLNGGAGSTLYVKESGSGTTGWAAK